MANSNKSKFYRVTANDPKRGGELISVDIERLEGMPSIAVWVENNVVPYFDNVKYEPLDRVLDSEIQTLLEKVKCSVADPLSNSQAWERLHCCRHMARIEGVSTQKSLRDVLARITDSERNYEIVGLYSPFSFWFRVSGMSGSMYFHETDKTWSLNT